MPTYTPHTITTSLNITKTGTSIVILSDSTYGIDNHLQSQFIPYLLEITQPDNSVLRYSSSPFYSPYTAFSSPSTFSPSQFSKTESVDLFGFYTIAFYQVPAISHGANSTYGLGDCFVSGLSVYKVINSDGVDVDIDTDLTDGSKYELIDIYDVPDKYKYEETIFLFHTDILNCINSIIERGACAIKESDKDTLCSNTDYLQAIEASIAKKVFNYASTNPALFSDGEIENVISYYTSYCADNECCTVGVIQSYEAGLNSCQTCEDEEDSSSASKHLTGLRWKTSNPVIQVSGNAKKRYFEELVGIEEDDIISVAVGDVEYSFEVEIVDWDKETGQMEFLNILADETTTGGFPVWIRIQWNVSA